MDKHNMPKKMQRAVGNVLLKYAYIPKANWKYMAAGIEQETDGKVSEADAMKGIEACDTNGNGQLSFKETKACLKKHAKSLGLKTKKDWESAKWHLAKIAEIN